MEAACRWFLQEAAAIPRLFPGEERDKRKAGRIRTQSLEEQPQKARTERRRGLTLLVPQELRLGTPCSWDVGIRRKGTAQLVMVPLKGPVISEQNLDPGPTVSATHCYCWDWGTCWVTFGANKWEEKSLCLGSKSVDRMQQTSGWQRWSEVFWVPDSVWWSRVWEGVFGTERQELKNQHNMLCALIADLFLISLAPDFQICFLFTLLPPC